MLRTGTVDGYYYVIGIRHDADNKIMTLDLHIPYPEYEKKTAARRKTIMSEILSTSMEESIMFLLILVLRDTA